MSLTKKEERLIRFAEKGGNDATLILLDNLEEIESKLEQITESFTEQIKELKDRVSPSSQEIKAVLEQTAIMMDRFSSVERLKGDRGELGDKGERGIDGTDGYTPIKNIDYFDGKDGKAGESTKGERGDMGKDGSPDTAEQIANKLNTLSEVIEQNTIKGLKDTFEKIRASMGGMRQGSFGGVLSVGVRVETPVGIVDGINTAFTAFKSPKYIVSDGITYFENNGYTIAGKSLTLTVPPSQYIRSFY